VGEVTAGPSGGALGTGGGIVTRDILENHPDIARQIVTIGRYKRTGHDRERWKTLNWDDYRAHVGIRQSAGPWRIEAAVSEPDDVTKWVTDAEDLPSCLPGVYTALVHDTRGLVMSDVPAEIAGVLPFLDTVAAWSAPRLLIAGLGLGIVPAWLLANTSTARVDVVEIDPDVIDLITRGRGERFAPNAWANDPRLHIHHADAHLWWPGRKPKRGCALHGDCVLWPNSTWQGAWFDIWDLVSPSNLPSMRRLTRHYARRVYRMWSWERPECEAMLRRGQTLERPCFISDTGYPGADNEGERR
jgi:hypothetical protein